MCGCASIGEEGPTQVNEPTISSRRAAAIVAALLLTTVAVVALVMLTAR
jgi:hypothetical protein